MDWNYWLGKKYQLLQQNADADTSRAQGFVTQANAGANLDTVRAGLLPAESQANIGLNAAQAALAAATARQQDEETKFVGPIARSNIAHNTADIRGIDAGIGYTSQQTDQLRNRNRLNVDLGSLYDRGFRFGL